MLIPVPLLAAGLAVIATLPGLLASLHLLQLKEWRSDRLRVHLQREGWLRPLFGIVRPAIVACALALSFVLPRTGVLLGVFALAATGPLHLSRQKLTHPVWTRKAMIITSIAVLLVAAFGAWSMSMAPSGRGLLLIALLHPLFAGLAVVLFLPADAPMKRRIMRRAERLRLRHAITVIGIAGSVGKTTTKELLHCLLAPLGAEATPVHVNSELGVAHWLLTTLARPEVPPILIVEMGAYRRGEIANLCRIAHPSMGLVTTLGRDHLGLFGSADAIRSANAELIHFLPEEGFAALLADDAALPQLTKAARCPVTTVGETAGDLRASDVHDTDDGLSFTVEKTPFVLPLRGRHNIGNALLALAVARKLGVSLRDCAQRLGTVTPMANTFAVRGEAGCLVLDDTYNSSPESVRAAITWAKGRGEPFKVLLTSGVMELGKEQDRILRELGEASRDVFQRIVFTTDAGRDAFAQGAALPVERLTPGSQRIPAGSLLVCVGRMPATAIRALLPTH